MQPTGSVNYHVHSDTRQAFHIDAGGVTGKLISPELVATVIDVKDVCMGDAAVRFAVDSVGFLRAPTKVTNFTAGELWKADYDRELTDLLCPSSGILGQMAA